MKNRAKTNHKILKEPIVDREARDKAIDVIQRYLNGELPNYESHDIYPISDDPTIFDTYLVLFWSEDHGYHLPWEKERTPEDSRDILERYILFLRTDNHIPLPLDPPKIKLVWWKTTLLIIWKIIVVLTCIIFWPIYLIWTVVKKQPRQPEDEPYWPFNSDEEYQKTLIKFGEIDNADNLQEK
jgi:hypothetical protein